MNQNMNNPRPDESAGPQETTGNYRFQRENQHILVYAAYSDSSTFPQIQFA